jgi:hypothetical protein
LEIDDMVKFGRVEFSALRNMEVVKHGTDSVEIRVWTHQDECAVLFVPKDKVREYINEIIAQLDQLGV